MTTGVWVSEGTGSAAPAGILTNKDLMAMVDTDDEWIRTRTGISQRHILGKGESLTMLGADAATKVLPQTGGESQPGAGGGVGGGEVCSWSGSHALLAWCRPRA